MGDHTVATVAHDDDGVLGVEGGDGGEDVADEGATCHLVEDLRGRRPHSRSLTGGKDDDGGRARAAHEGGCSPDCGGRGVAHDTCRSPALARPRPYPVNRAL
jgi:hypothetical protein